MSNLKKKPLIIKNIKNLVKNNKILSNFMPVYCTYGSYLIFYLYQSSQ